MSCNKPWRGFRWPDGTMRSTRSPGSKLESMELPCNRCTGCKIEKARGWALRCQHEASLWKHESGKHRGAPKNCFLTLTLSDDGLRALEIQNPERPKFSLDVRDWQLLAKKMRNEIGPFRFLQVGEYGPKNLRPHYHALIFGQDFTSEDEKWERAKSSEENGRPYFVSPRLAKLWPWGTHLIGEMTPETVNYVCRYTVKKQFGTRSEKEIERVDYETGEWWQVNPPYATMSRRPGIGSEWFTKYHGDLFPADYAIMKGKPVKTPKYYLDKLGKKNEEMREEVRKRRCKFAAGRASDNTPERRLVREKIAKRMMKDTQAGKLD